MRETVATPSRALLRQWPSPWLSWLHLATLSGFAIAEPLYGLLRRFAPMMVAHQAGGAEIIVLIAAVSLGIPTTLALPALLARNLSLRLGAALHLLAISLLSALWLSPVLKGWNLEGGWYAGAVSAFGLLLALLYVRQSSLRRLLSWLSPAAGLFALFFYFSGSVQSLTTPVGTAKAIEIPPSVETPIFFVVFDELPLISLLDGSETIDRGRFPSIARLADDAIWYRNATTVSESTYVSVPAIVSGRLPASETALAVVADHPATLFSLLGGSYQLNVIESVTSLCPDSLCSNQGPRGSLDRSVALLADCAAIYLHRVVPPGWAFVLPAVDQGWSGFWENRLYGVGGSSDRDLEAFERFLSPIAESPPRTLHFWHSLLPHRPWRRTPDGHTYSGPLLRLVDDTTWAADAWSVSQARQRHLLQVGYLDTLVGRLVAHLEELDLYEQSMIVLVADHGAAFVESQWRRHAVEQPVDTLVDIANVPLIVKYPNQQFRGIDDRWVQTTDILPTIFEALGIPAPSGVEGKPLQAPRKTPDQLTLHPMPYDDLEVTQYPISRMLARGERVRRTAERFGEGNWSSVFAIGPYGWLVGTPSEEVPRIAGIDTEILHSRLFETVDLNTGHLPLMVRGSVKAGSFAPRWVAISVNGTVAAVGRSGLLPRAGASGESWEAFAGLIESGRLKAGRNQVDAFVLDTGRLRPRSAQGAQLPAAR